MSLLFICIRNILSDIPFSLSSRQGKIQKRGKLSLVGKLILTTEKAKREEEEGIVQLRILRVQVMTADRLVDWLNG